MRIPSEIEPHPGDRVTGGTIREGQRSADIHATPELWLRDGAGHELRFTGPLLDEARVGHEVVLVADRRQNMVVALRNLSAGRTFYAREADRVGLYSLDGMASRILVSVLVVPLCAAPLYFGVRPSLGPLTALADLAWGWGLPIGCFVWLSRRTATHRAGTLTGRAAVDAALRGPDGVPLADGKPSPSPAEEAQLVAVGPWGAPDPARSR